MTSAEGGTSICSSAVRERPYGGRPCPTNPEHGPLVRVEGGDGTLWRCVSYEHEPYGGVEYAGKGYGHVSPGRMVARPRTRSVWTEAQLDDLT